MKPFWMLIVLIYFNSWGQTLNYYPLEVGNKWQYFVRSSTGYPFVPSTIYSLSYRIVSADTLVNNKKYFNTSTNFWMRYDSLDKIIYRLLGDSEYVYMDFNLPAGATFQQIQSVGSYRTVSVVTKNITLFNATVQAIGYYFFNPTGPPYYKTYEEYYAPGFGLVQLINYSTGPMGYNLTTIYNPIEIYLIDSSTVIYYKNNTLPIFNSISHQILSDYRIELNVEVKHKYSKVSVTNQYPYIGGFSYVDSLHAEFFYSKGSVMEPITNFEFQVIDEENYSIKIPYSRLLYSQGYNQIAYRFTTKDKAIIPNYYTYPDTGYGIIQVSLSDNPDTAYYPLHVNNEWVYQKLRITNTGNYIHDSYVRTKILKDTVLSNNKKYKKISHFDGNTYYERMDSFFATTYRAVCVNNEIIERQIDSISARLNNEYISYRLFPDTNVIVLSYYNEPSNFRKIALVDNPQTRWEIRKNKGLTFLQTYKDTSGGYSGTIYQLAASRINGVTTGDTTLLTGYFSLAATYHPLKIGNQWVYELYEVLPGDSKSNVDYFTLKVIGDTVLHDGYYYKINTSHEETIYQRIDSISANLFQYYPDSLKTVLIDALNASIGSTINSYRLLPFNKVTFYQQEETSEFGITSNVKYFRANENYNCFYRLKDKLGLTLFRITPDAITGRIGRTLILKAAYIDGVMYGDTSLLDIREETELPHSYALEQNYPNPFNPVTTIRYAIPNSVETLHATSLRIYDMLGREVAVLVNEDKPPGNYEVVFDASKLSSGVYIYRLTTQDFTASRKMLVVK